jgi:hypothetical protein
MRTGFRRATQKIGEILYLAVSSKDFNQNTMTSAKNIDTYYYNQKEKNQRD